jgi:glucose/arabinose dehydrogenase
MNRVKSRIIFPLGAIIFLALAMFFYREQILRLFYKPTGTSLERGLGISPKINPSLEGAIEIIADNLKIPWEIAFLPNGENEGQQAVSGADLLVTERPGTLKRIGRKGRVYIIEGVKHVGEGGLLGMALHPRFSENHWIYLYFTTSSDTGFKNRVERYRLENDRLLDRRIIIDNIPGAAYHDGGRIAFGPDGYLYITTGDAGNSKLAQDVNSLAGKILRLKDDGSIPADNPFGNAVYSYGHRNSQGLAWDKQGHLWATEHGRSGILSGFDEINLIMKGKNYGWPIIQGDEKKEGMESPVIHSGPDETWAPAGMAFWNNSLFFGGLRGESLYEAKILNDGKVSLRAHFRKEFGRIRAVVLGPDGYLYITTSNTDGRGDAGANDDKIIRINPDIFRL